MENKNYTARILNSSPLQLVIITYELMLEDMDKALSAENKVTAKSRLLNVRAFLTNLIGSLDMSMEISGNMASIYIYINKLISEAMLKSSLDKKEEAVSILAEAKDLITVLFNAWKAIESEDVRKSSQKGSQVFAGLTYKKGRLAEHIDENSNRDYKA
ncbi:flagellar protein FliS [Anaeropeptidivorans aminofermentans]|jgi:flagellar protein FliS|uniref:flagellar protein FliS n=1 Tax=Anaeropeptidivorans aminofermentans TaxID=2934315 RepID=UPI002023F319|nr:flagellar protein FliS [Anaeropeptidivorans aminofermentans]